MTPRFPSLSACHRAAERVEAAVEQLGSDWSGRSPILQACFEFRRSCEQLAGNRGLAEITIAFIGPKNAGKSTVAGLLILSDEKRRRLKIGDTSQEATTKPAWIAPREPALLDPQREDFIPCHESELAPLGFPYAVLDVPGFNESSNARQVLAIHALDFAVVKVLVIDRRSIESEEIARYLQGAAGAPILLVVNHIRSEEERADLAEWEENLRRRFPTLLPRIEIPDWELQGDVALRRSAARDLLVQRLTQVIAGRAPDALAEPQLARKLREFEQHTAKLASKYLPATSAALTSLQEALAVLPAQAVETLLGTERVITAHVRLRFRAILLERTPIVFFPWRLALSVANLVHGATDRLPLAMMGSIPSMLTTAFAAAKNVKDAREFAEQATSGLRTRVNSLVKELAGPQLEVVDAALQREIGIIPAVQPAGRSATATLRGLETLQARSSEIFSSLTEQFAPGRIVAGFTAMIGFVLFWGILAWPIYGLYHDYWFAAHDVTAGQKSALDAFPSGAVSMLLTSTVLALLPMGIFLLLVLAVSTRRAKAQACALSLRVAHAAELQRLTDHGQIEVVISEPQIDACRTLLRLGR